VLFEYYENIVKFAHFFKKANFCPDNNI